MPYKNKEIGKEYHKNYHKKWYEKHKTKRQTELKSYINKWYPTPSGRYASHKSSCKMRGLVNEITLQEFTNLIGQKCIYCGGDGHGIDRVDNSIGYIKSNCVPSCAMCNYMKKHHSEKDFIEHCVKVANFNNN